MLKKEIIPVSRKSNLVVQELGNDILIYDLSENKAFSLNKTSALIWQLCNGNRTVSDIAKNLSEKFDSPINEDFVWLALDGLKKEKLLENPNEISTKFGELSRREVIRKVGYATLVALPVVSSLIAPMAVHAASCSTGSSGRGLGCPCTSIGQCRPPANRCCLSTIGAPGNQTCVTNNTIIADGGSCGNACSCISNCCAGGNCVAFGAVPSNGLCTVNCQCSSGTCGVGNLCT